MKALAYKKRECGVTSAVLDTASKNKKSFFDVYKFFVDKNIDGTDDLLNAWPDVKKNYYEHEGSTTNHLQQAMREVQQDSWYCPETNRFSQSPSETRMKFSASPGMMSGNFSRCPPRAGHLFGLSECNSCYGNRRVNDPSCCHGNRSPNNGNINGNFVENLVSRSVDRHEQAPPTTTDFMSINNLSADRLDAEKTISVVSNSDNCQVPLLPKVTGIPPTTTRLTPPTQRPIQYSSAPRDSETASGISDLDNPKLHQFLPKPSSRFDEVVEEVNGRRCVGVSKVDPSPVGVSDTSGKSSGFVSNINGMGHVGVSKTNGNSFAFMPNIDGMSPVGVSNTDGRSSAFVSNINEACHMGVSDTDGRSSGFVSNINGMGPVGVSDTDGRSSGFVSNINGMGPVGVSKTNGRSSSSDPLGERRTGTVNYIPNIRLSERAGDRMADTGMGEAVGGREVEADRQGDHYGKQYANIPTIVTQCLSDDTWSESGNLGQSTMNENLHLSLLNNNRDHPTRSSRELDDNVSNVCESDVGPSASQINFSLRERREISEVENIARPCVLPEIAEADLGLGDREVGRWLEGVPGAEELEEELISATDHRVDTEEMKFVFVMWPDTHQTDRVMDELMKYFVRNRICFAIDTPKELMYSREMFTEDNPQPTVNRNNKFYKKLYDTAHLVLIVNDNTQLSNNSYQNRLYSILSWARQEVRQSKHPSQRLIYINKADIKKKKNFTKIKNRFQRNEQ